MSTTYLMMLFCDSSGVARWQIKEDPTEGWIAARTTTDTAAVNYPLPKFPLDEAVVVGGSGGASSSSILRVKAGSVLEEEDVIDGDSGGGGGTNSSTSLNSRRTYTIGNCALPTGLAGSSQGASSTAITPVIFPPLKCRKLTKLAY